MKKTGSQKGSFSTSKKVKPEMRKNESAQKGETVLLEPVRIKGYIQLGLNGSISYVE